VIKLSVNVNKIATLRNSRGGKWPSVREFSFAAMEEGAHGITVHPRPDERHIRETDVYELAELTAGRVEFNIEGFPDDRYLRLVRETRPTQATLVPDPPDALTSNAGWDAQRHADLLRRVVAELKESAGRVSLFLEPELHQVEAAKATGADRIEFYTEPFAVAFEQGEGEASFAHFDRAAKLATEIGLEINAGHDLNLKNMVLMRRLTGLKEVSIGHAIVCDALWMGWRPTIRAYLEVLKREESAAAP
jgi:pyridoxine 5-phosphate synthase